MLSNGLCGLRCNTDTVKLAKIVVCVWIICNVAALVASEEEHIEAYDEPFQMDPAFHYGDLPRMRPMDFPRREHQPHSHYRRDGSDEPKIIDYKDIVFPESEEFDWSAYDQELNNNEKRDDKD